MAPQPTETLVAPTLLPSFNLEWSVHRPSRLLRNDIELVFRPDLEAEFQRHERGAGAGAEKDVWMHEHLLAVPTWQPSERDLSEMSNVVNEERRALLDKFDVWATAVRAGIGSGYWSDCSCPMEGNARFGTCTSAIYNELEGLTSLLKYDSIPIGCCGIVLHPTWQRRAYPVTFFTTAPPELLARVVAEVEAARARGE